MTGAVTAEVRNSVLVLCLDRPEARNAINSEVSRSLREAFERLDRDPDLRVGVLTGRGPTFCAGLDLKEFALSGTPKGVQSVIRHGTAKPLIAAVEGAALGGGLELVLVADIVVAARDAVFALPEVRVGLFPGAGALFRLPARMPQGCVAELAFTGEPISAERAYGLGLVSRLTEPGRALDEAMTLAESIGKNAPLGLQASKRLIRGGQGTKADEFWALQHELVVSVFGSQDAREGAAAFAEKRSPVWRGA